MLKPAQLPVPQLAISIGDPHFIGFEGESFDFMGEPNRYYNLLTDREVQINAHFVYWQASGTENLTATDEIGILINDHRIHITLADPNS